MEIGPKSPENKPARPFDLSSNDGKESRPLKRPKRDHRRSSSPNFPEDIVLDSEDDEREVKCAAQFYAIDWIVH
jgi:hypothetical protein